MIRLISAKFVSLLFFDTKQESQRFCCVIYLGTTVKCRMPGHLLDPTLCSSAPPGTCGLLSGNTRRAGADSSFTAPSGFLTQRAVRLVEHGLPFFNPCWLFPAALFSLLCPQIQSKRTHSMIFLGTDLTLPGLQCPWLSLGPFLEKGTMFAFLQLQGYPLIPTTFQA